MKKIIITESQSKKVMSKILAEQLSPQERYSQEVNCSFGYHKLTYQGNEIDWISDRTFTVSFIIYLDAREYGIKDISVFDFKGPEAIEVEITYYPGDDEDPAEEYITLPLNWDDVNAEQDADIGWIGIDRDVEIELTQTPDGGLAVGSITLHSRGV